MKKRSKKEILITIAGGVALCGMLGTMTGCFSEASDADKVEIVLSMYAMEEPNDCLMCLGCINTKTASGCCGPDYTYMGCVDCFGITTNEDTKSGDIAMAFELCGGYYCVNMEYGIDGEVTPIYGCYKKK